MSNKEIAIQYLDGFAEGDLNRIRNVLSDGFELNGPFYSGKTAADYISTLESDPPDKSSYRIVSTSSGTMRYASFTNLKKRALRPIWPSCLNSMQVRSLVERGQLIDFWKWGDGPSNR